MKKLAVSICLFIAFISHSYGQNPDFALAKAMYTFKHVNDTTKRDQPKQFETVLYLGSKGSLYRRVMDEESKPLLYVSKGGNLESFDIIEESAAQIFLDGKSYRAERIVDNKYLITQEKPHIPWELSDEIKEIKGFEVQKASAEYGGRFYTAWFTTEIPFSYGPWQLQGLPGLILEAYDDKKEVIFEFIQLETKNIDNKNGKITIPKSPDFKKVTHEEFEKIYQGFLSSPMAFIRASLGLTAESQAVIQNVDNSKKEPYNPLILKK